jgi:hypothetical protein
MGKKWRTNKNSNRKHKRTKTKRIRMRGGLNVPDLFGKTVTNVDIVRYLIKQTPPKPIDVQFVNPNNKSPPNTLVTFDKLDDDLKGELYYEEPNNKIRMYFSVAGDTLKISDVNDDKKITQKNRTILKRSEIKFVTDANFKNLKNEVSEDMVNTEKQEKARKEQEEMDAKAKKEQEEQEEQEKTRILEEKKATTLKIIKVNLLTATKKGLVTIKTWYDTYKNYELKPDNDKIFTIPPPSKEDNTWNFDFFLKCLVTHHDINELPDTQKSFLEHILKEDLNKLPLKYTSTDDDKSGDITFTKPGLIFMAIPGDPKKYGGCIIYDMDGKNSKNVQLHTPKENVAIEYFNGTNFEEKTPSVIMEEYLQGLFPQFKPPPEEKKEDAVAPEVTDSTEAPDAASTEKATPDAATTKEATTDAVATETDADTTEEETPDAAATTKEATTDAVATETDTSITDAAAQEADTLTTDATTEEADTSTTDATTEEAETDPEAISPPSEDVKPSKVQKVVPVNNAKVVPVNAKVIQNNKTANAKINSVSKPTTTIQEPVKVEEIILEDTSNNEKEKQQQQQQIINKDKINQNIIEVLNILNGIL